MGKVKHLDSRQEGLLSEDQLGAGRYGRRVCKPSTWTDADHRSILTVSLYRTKVSGATDTALGDLIKNGTIRLDKVTTIELPRKAEWRGW